MPEMDTYTEDTKSWLDRRFRQVDADGVYFAHQPIYGFRQGHSEAWPTTRYIITLQILRALAHLRFSTLLDVGGAEGYKAALIRDVFGVATTSCDLSAEASRRAEAIFGVPGRPVDIHALPFADGEFDVVLSSETLEHVSRIEDATRELLRVARTAVVITVPREPIEVVERNIRENVPHGHIHALRPNSFEFTRPVARRIVVRRMLCNLLTKACSIADAMPRGEGGADTRPIVRLYDRALPVIRRVIGKGAVARLLELDDRCANAGLPFQGMLFVLVKDEAAYAETPRIVVRPEQVLDFAVPLHYPNGATTPPSRAAAGR